MAAELEVIVVPRADRDAVGPFADGVLRVRVTRPPADGKANRAVQWLLAGALEVPPSSVRLVAGERARRKRFAMSTLEPSELQRRLAAALD